MTDRQRPPACQRRHVAWTFTPDSDGLTCVACGRHLHADDDPAKLAAVLNRLAADGWAPSMLRAAARTLFRIER